MKPIWIIENIVKEPSFRELADAVMANGYACQELTGDFENSLLNFYYDKCVIVNGSIQMCKLIGDILKAEGRNCAPVLYCSWEKYFCSRYYGPLGRFLFNDNFVMVPFSELKRRTYDFYRFFGKEAMIFVRPDDGDKSFKGGLTDLQDCARFCDQFDSEKDKLIVISTPKTILGEWRFVVCDEPRIIAQSCYRYHGQKTLIPTAPKGATELCQNILSAGYHPDRVYCIDICQDFDGDFWLMELNSFSSAGLYACDKTKIAIEVSEIAERDYASV